MIRNILKFSVEEKRALQVNETVAAYGYSRSTLYKLINSSKLRTIKIGKRRLIPIDAGRSASAGRCLRDAPRKSCAPAHRYPDAGRREIATLGSSQLSDSANSHALQIKLRELVEKARFIASRMN
jgi:hypothetical protein